MTRPTDSRLVPNQLLQSTSILRPDQRGSVEEDSFVSIEPGQNLQHYRIVEKIGEGGMGVVWNAEDTVLNRTVAIKVLPADVVRDEKRRKMFFDEARLASSVSEAHIVQVHEFGHEGDLDFIVMEYVEGKPLNKIIHGRPLPPDKIAELVLQVAQALSRAHRKGLLHRDLKPANILVTTDGDVKVADFGLATLFAPTDISGWDQTTRSSTLTMDPTSLEGSPARGSLAGTIAYMSPEQVRCEELDGRSDIFSIGVILYEMATGQRPFSAPTNEALLRKILESRPVPPHQLVSDLPLELNRIIQKALGRRPADRYQTMDDLGVDLRSLGRQLESGSSPSYEDMAKSLAPRSNRQWLIGISAGVVALLAFLLVGWWIVVGRAPELDERSILILPLEIRGQTAAAAYAGRAFAEAIAFNLAKTRELKVLPIGRDGELTDEAAFGLARRGGAGRLLTGSLLREGEAVQASLSLMDVAENRILWGTERGEPQGDVSSLATVLAKEVAVQLGATFPIENPFLIDSQGKKSDKKNGDVKKEKK